MAYMNENEPRESDLLQTGGKGEILDLGDEETNALIDKIMQGTEESGDIIDLDFLLSGVPDTQSEPSATPARYSFAFHFQCSSLLASLDSSFSLFYACFVATWLQQLKSRQR